MKLSIKTTHILTTEQLEIYCDPPLTFEVVGSIDPHTRKKLGSWYEADYPTNRAVEFIPSLFITVAQNGIAYPLKTVEDAAAFQEAVGDVFLSRLVERTWAYDINQFKKKQVGSISLSKDSDDGAEQDTQP